MAAARELLRERQVVRPVDPSGLGRRERDRSEDVPARDERDADVRPDADGAEKLEVWDSPNSAGIVTDAVRCCKLAMNSGIAGQLDGPSSYLMKSPMSQRPDHLAREATERFIAENSRSQAAARRAEQAAETVAEQGSTAVT